MTDRLPPNGRDRRDRRDGSNGSNGADPTSSADDQPSAPDTALLDELRRLGSVAELATAPTSASDIVDQTLGVDLDRALGEGGSAGIGSLSSSRPRRSRLVIAAAAATVLLAGIAGLAAMNRTTDPEAVTATVAGQPDDRRDVAVASASQPEADDNGWAEFRECESEGDYSADTGNTFYGAYQFTQATWETVGGSGNPAEAHPLEQDLRAALLYDQRGAQPWPICGSELSGPPPNPLIPQWEEAWQQPHTVIIFAEPGADLTDAELTALTDTIAPDGAPSIVSQVEAYEEFAASFSHIPQIVDSVDADDMPRSARLVLANLAGLDNEAVRELRMRPDVLEVVVSPHHRLFVDIPALGIEGFPLLTDWSLDDLRTSIAPIAPNGWGPGSSTPTDRSSENPPLRVPEWSEHALPHEGPLVLASASTEWRLGNLKDGDLIRVIRPSSELGRGLSSTATAEVVGEVISAPAERLASSDLRSLYGGEILLVAPDPDDPARRLVVRTRPVDPTR